MRRRECPELVGRNAERSLLLTALDDARRGRGRLVLVTGEAGVGKTRLVTELAQEAEDRTCTVLSGRTVDTVAPVPLRPLFEALSGHVRRVGVPTDIDARRLRGPLAHLVPEWRVDGEEPYRATPMEIGEALLRLLTSLSGEGCVLILEDLHWADPETVAVVEYVGDNIRSTSVLCIGTARPEAPDVVRRAFHDLERRDRALVVELDRLGVDDVGRMSALCLGVEQLSDEVISFVARFTDGLPLLIEEIVESSVTDGTLTTSAGGLQVAAGARPSVPQRFAELVRRRMDGLDEATIKILRAASVVGNRFDLGLLRTITGTTSETMGAALRQGVAARLVTDVRADSAMFEFRHAMIRDAVVDDLLAFERVEIAQRALTVLERERPDLSGTLSAMAASLAEEVGDRARAADFLLLTGLGAAHAGALASAVPALLRAWSFVDDGTPAWLETGRALIPVLAGTGATDDALDVGQRLLVSTSDPEQAAVIHVLMARAAASASRFGPAADHATTARDLVADINAAQAVAAASDAVRAEIAAGEGRFDYAEAFARSALAVAEQAEDHELWAASMLVIGRCERGRGSGDPAATFESVMRLGRDRDLPVWRLRALMERASLALWNFEPPRGLLAAREEAERSGALVAVAHLDNFLAVQAHDHRNTEQIDIAALRCIALSRKLRLRTLEGVATVVRACGAAQRGERNQIEALIAEAESISNRHVDVLAMGAVARATYWVHRADTGRSRSALAVVMQRLADTPALGCPERGLWALLEVIDGADGRAAIEHLDRFTGPGHAQIEAYRNYARAVLHGRDGDLPEADRCVAVAESVQPTPWFQHHARLLIAASAHRHGWGEPIRWLDESSAYFDGRGDDHLASSCRTMLTKLGQHASRRTRRHDQVPVELRGYGVTARESEVLALLAEARSTRDIATLLHLSPKTVERHIANLATKLGVDGRTGVVAFGARITTGAS
jgi:DNA-binding CsgD family transcriptional regulator